MHRLRSLIGIVFMAMIAGHICAQTYHTDPEELQDAVNAAGSAGGEFIVPDGTYTDFNASFQVLASEANPIIIRAESVGGVTLMGESHFVFKKSAHVILQGFVFDALGDETMVKLEGCHHIRITRNVFELETTESVKWVFIGGVWDDNTFPFQYPSHHNRVDHNLFQNKTLPGHYITLDGSFDDSNGEEVYYQSQHDRIDYNYFKNNGPRAVNEQESIRIGWSEMSLSSGFTTVEHNLFEDCDGDPEIISVKSCDNVIRHNTFRASYGTLSLRHGNRNRVEGNFFFGNGKPIGLSDTGASLYTGGIRIYGTDHVIINNYMEGLTGTRWDAPVTLTQGDAIDGESSNLSKHFRAERVTIAHNTLVNNAHGIEIGFDNNDQYNKELLDITIAHNLITGSENGLVEIVDVANDQGEAISWSMNLMYPTGTAAVLLGASSTSFDMTESINEDPLLSYEAASGLWRSGANSPEYESSLTDLTVDSDMDGQSRPSMSNPGADHFSSNPVLFGPLSAADVGPQAYGSVNMLGEQGHSALRIFPVPAQERLRISGLTRGLTRVDVRDQTGKLVISEPISIGQEDAQLDTSVLSEGIYVIIFQESLGLRTARRIIIQR